jgi:hypothetical protein
MRSTPLGKSRWIRESGQSSIAAAKASRKRSCSGEIRAWARALWRFSPRAAATARDFLFHPTQEMTEDVGGLTVRFTASGWLEMAWHLYLWGDQVEVLAPEALAQMVAAHRRSDFPALP